MKRLLTLGCALLGMVFGIGAATTNTLTFAWNASPDAGVAFYRLHWGTNSGSYQRSLDATNLTQTVTNFFLGTNFLAVTALSAQGLESDPSNEIDVLLPRSPSSLRVTAVMQAANSLDGPWTDVLGTLFPDQLAQFYRFKVRIVDLYPPIPK